MEIDGSKVSFTPAEARWAQAATMRFNSSPDLSQRILDAEIKAFDQWLPELHVPNVSDAARNIIARLALGEVGDELEIAAEKYEVSPLNNPHVVSLKLTEHDKAELLRLAQVDYEVAQERIETPEMVAIEDAEMREDAAFFIAMSDTMEPDQAVILGDMVRDSELVDKYEAELLEEANQTKKLVAPIVSMLKRELG